MGGSQLIKKNYHPHIALFCFVSFYKSFSFQDVRTSWSSMRSLPTRQRVSDANIGSGINGTLFFHQKTSLI